MYDSISYHRRHCVGVRVHPCSARLRYALGRSQGSAFPVPAALQVWQEARKGRGIIPRPRVFPLAVPLLKAHFQKNKKD